MKTRVYRETPYYLLVIINIHSTSVHFPSSLPLVPILFRHDIAVRSALLAIPHIPLSPFADRFVRTSPPLLSHPRRIIQRDLSVPLSRCATLALRARVGAPVSLRNSRFRLGRSRSRHLGRLLLHAERVRPLRPLALLMKRL